MYIDLPMSHICFPSGPDKQLQLWSTAIKRMKTKVNKTIKHSKSFIIFKYLNRIFMIFIKTFFISAIVLQEVFNWVLKEIPDGVNVALLCLVIGLEAWSAGKCEGSKWSWFKFCIWLIGMVIQVLLSVFDDFNLFYV